MLLQVGGSISFAPEGEGADAKWLSDDTRHMLAELTPKPDQVTIAINTNQMNVTELLTADDCGNTTLGQPALLCRLQGDDHSLGPGLRGRAPEAPAGRRHPAALHAGDVGQLETVERYIRRATTPAPWC